MGAKRLDLVNPAKTKRLRSEKVTRGNRERPQTRVGWSILTTAVTFILQFLTFFTIFGRNVAPSFQCSSSEIVISTPIF